ncbi:MAG: hypothetical protein ACI9CO_002174 [Candidatus Azotimanducaceae bacterium]
MLCRRELELFIRMILPIKMKLEMHDIINSYLLRRRSGESVADSAMEAELLARGVSNEKIKDLLLKLDDEGTADEADQLIINGGKKKTMLGYVVCLLSLVVTGLTFFGLLFNAEVSLFLYGPLAAGILLVINGRRSISKGLHREELRRKKWENWW